VARSAAKPGPTAVRLNLGTLEIVGHAGKTAGIRIAGQFFGDGDDADVGLSPDALPSRRRVRRAWTTAATTLSAMLDLPPTGLRECRS
jgi:hypothetical protein